MNLINKVVIILFVCCLITLLISWNYRSFELFCVSSSLLLLSITINFKSIRNLVLPIFATILTITVVECSLFIFYSSQSVKSYASKKYFQKIPGFGFKALPGIHSSRKLTKNKEIMYDVTYTIGSDGYRKDTNEDVYDAYIYGGSFAFGEGLNDDETISYYLKKKYQINVKNLGMHGFGLHQALYNIQHGITSKKPQGINILLTSPWHSLRSSCKPNFSIGTPRYILDNGSLKRDSVCQHTLISKVLSKSNIVKFLNLKVKKHQNTITDKDIELYIEIIKEIKKLSKANKALLVIAYIDASKKDLLKTSWTNQTLLSKLSIVADKVIDVTLAENYESLNPKFYIHTLDKHPSSIANMHRSDLLHQIFTK